MTVSSINGQLFTALSALSGRTLSTLSHVNGQEILSGPLTPSDMADIWMWGEPSREGLSNNDPMPTFTDQTGNGRDWTQATSAKRPIFLTNQINGLGTSDHDAAGSQQKGWDGPDMSALTAGHIFLVVLAYFYPAANFTNQALWYMLNNSGEFEQTVYGFPLDSKIYDGWGSTARKAGFTPSVALNGTYKLYEVISTSSEWTALLNGTQDFTTGTNTVGFPSNPNLGYNADESQMLQGRIAGMYIFSAKKSGAGRTEVIDYINDRFATSYS